jgi:hypothetical protein
LHHDYSIDIKKYPSYTFARKSTAQTSDGKIDIGQKEALNVGIRNTIWQRKRPTSERIQKQK